MIPNRNNMNGAKYPAVFLDLSVFYFVITLDYSKILLLKFLHSVSELFFDLERKFYPKYRFTGVTAFSDLVPFRLQPSFLIGKHVCL